MTQKRIDNVFYVHENGVDTKYIIIDYSNELRFAIAFNELNNLFGVETQNKDIETIIAEVTNVLKDKGQNDDKSFMRVQQYYAEKIIALKEKGLSVKEPVCFSFFVHPDTKGIRQATGVLSRYSLHELYPEALQVDSTLFKQGYTCSAEKCYTRYQEAAIHELVHVLHSGYFGFDKFGVIGEGFAEMVPYYLMDMEVKDVKHHTAIIHLNEQDILPLDFVNKCGVFSLGDKPFVQDLRTYQSMYLWMIGYMKRVEKIYQCDKFKATERVLKKFSQIAKIPNYYKRMKMLAGFISTPDDKISVQALMNGRILQMLGKSYTTKVIKKYNKDNGLTVNHIQEDKTNPLMYVIENASSLEKLGSIGILFQDVVPNYLGVTPKKLSKNEHLLLQLIEHFQEKYGLTKQDTVCAICDRLAKTGEWKQKTPQKQEYIAWLFSVDKDKVKALWRHPVIKKQSGKSVVAQQRTGREISQ